jgi:hypothetical protein
MSSRTPPVESTPPSPAQDASPPLPGEEVVPDLIQGITSHIHIIKEVIISVILPTKYKRKWVHSKFLSLKSNIRWDELIPNIRDGPSHPIPVDAQPYQTLTRSLGMATWTKMVITGRLCNGDNYEIHQGHSSTVSTSHICCRISPLWLGAPF